MSEPDDTAKERALDLAGAIAGFWHRRIGDELLGVYLLGSLAHGGFNRRYSDIDLGVIAETPLGEDALDAMRAEAEAAFPDLAPKLSLFWADRSFSAGRFPPLDRLDYLDHAVPLAESERVRPDRPTLEEVRAYLAGAPFGTWAHNAERFAALEALEPGEHKPYLRAHLYPARLIYSWDTGRMASNDAAVAYLTDTRPAGLDLGLIERALACRHAAADPDGLFSDRGVLPAQVAACARHMGL